jgi:hypothetical protein
MQRIIQITSGAYGYVFALTESGQLWELSESLDESTGSEIRTWSRVIDIPDEEPVPVHDTIPVPSPDVCDSWIR